VVPHRFEPLGLAERRRGGAGGPGGPGGGGGGGAPRPRPAGPATRTIYTLALEKPSGGGDPVAYVLAAGSFSDLLSRVDVVEATAAK
jgi:hypothetical protein